MEQEQDPRGRFSKDVLVIDQLRYKLDSVGFLIDKNWHLFTVQGPMPWRKGMQMIGSTYIIEFYSQ